MIDFKRNSKTPANRFGVRVGHQRVQVSATTREEAIEHARRRLCAELPRLYDVIRNLDNTRFEVELLER